MGSCLETSCMKAKPRQSREPGGGWSGGWDGEMPGMWLSGILLWLAVEKVSTLAIGSQWGLVDDWHGGKNLQPSISENEVNLPYWSCIKTNY